MNLSPVRLRITVMRYMAIRTLPLFVVVLLSSCGAGSSSGGERLAILGGDGIGTLKFGQSPAVVAARLGQRFGPPVDAKQFQNGYQPDVCGFYSEVWNGLGAASDGRQFAAQLTAWFRNSRFVGYAYADDFRETVWRTDWSQYASHRMMLATGNGLAVGDPVLLARRLYGRRFILTRQSQGTPPDPRLDRLPIWEVSTAGGRVEGGIGSAAFVGDAFGKHRIGIHSIAAGASPNTPCK